MLCQENNLTQRQQNKGDDRGLQETAEGARPLSTSTGQQRRRWKVKFLSLHITDKLKWSSHTDSVVKKAQQRLFNLRRLKKFGLSPKTLTNLYRCTIESILSGCITAWYSNCTTHNCRALKRVLRSAQRITGGKPPSLQDSYSTRCHREVKKILKDKNHLSHCLFTPHSSRRRGQYRCIKAGTERLKNSFSRPSDCYIAITSAEAAAYIQTLNHCPL